jgi:hypothetical protein
LSSERLEDGAVELPPERRARMTPRKPIRVSPGAKIDTKFVKHELRGMKRNVTIVMDEDTARWVRVEAARRDLSVSAYLGQVVKQEQEKAEGYALAMKRFLSREPRPLAPPEVPLPSRGELHERR